MKNESRIKAKDIAVVPVGRVKPYEHNARKHPREQIEALQRSLKEYGFVTPLLVDKDFVLIKGHGTFKAALANKFSEVPVIVASWLTAAQVKAYRIADNALADLSEWNRDVLKMELTDLQKLDFNIGAFTGLDGAMFQSLDLPGFELQAKLDAADETPPVPKKPVVKRGDLWRLGAHRLLCGDSTNKDDVAHLMGKDRPHLMVTDPPYGVDYDADWRNRADRANGKPYGASAIGRVTNDDRSNWSEAWALCPCAVIYVWHPSGAKQIEFYQSIVQSGFEIRMQIIWAKQQFPIGRGNYHVQHEPCWYAVRKGKTAHWSGSRKESTLWTINKPVKSETGHSTQKPIECMRRPILNNSKPKEFVYDPFVGSGTTIIAAEMESRRCLAIEIDPAYAQLTIERWQKYAEKEAKRDDGATLKSLART